MPDGSHYVSSLKLRYLLPIQFYINWIVHLKVIDFLPTQLCGNYTIRNADAKKKLSTEHRGSIVPYSCSCHRMAFR